MQTVRVWRHERDQWIQNVRSELGLAKFVDGVDIRKHSMAKAFLRTPRGGSSVCLEFLLIFPQTAGHQATYIAVEFVEQPLTEIELMETVKAYSATLIDGLALIQRFSGGQDQFFELSWYSDDGLRPHIQQDENSEPHISFIEWSRQLYHSQPAPREK